MNRLVFIIFIALICGIVACVFLACSRENEKEMEWSGRLKDGRVVTERDLEWNRNTRLDLQKRFNISKGEEISKEALEILRSTEINKNHLEEANLSNAYLVKARLEGVNLRKADLSRANLNKAILKTADLRDANLVGVNLSEADLQGADMRNANLAIADISSADLREANLKGADLGSKLFGADLRGADLSDVDLLAADLKEARLDYAVLQKASMVGADLRHAKLISADLSDADLRKADLRGADLSGAILKGADLREAEGLPELGESFRKAGSFDNAHLIAYTIKRAEWEKSGLGSFRDRIKSLFNLIFFDFTCQYGLKHRRPLIILLCLIPYFAFFYIFALTDRNRKTGIWLILKNNRSLEATIKERSFKLTFKFPPRHSAKGILNKIGLKLACWFRMVRIGLYFSLLSAFKIGWREINTQNLITRLQRRDYALRASGWARSLAGIQSLLSIFLLVLWVLTTFGHPF